MSDNGGGSLKHSAETGREREIEKKSNFLVCFDKNSPGDISIKLFMIVIYGCL
jgi:hypothetical protein